MGQVYGRHIEDPTDRDGHVVFGDEALVRDELQEPGALFFLLLEEFLHLLGGEQPILHQGVGDAFSE